MIWHSQNINSVLSELKSDSKVGLTQQEAAIRLKEYGTNEISGTRINPTAVFLKHIFSKTSLFLLALAFIWLIVSAIWENGSFEFLFLILFVLIKGVILGCFEYFGRKGILALFSKQRPTATVIRDGKAFEILSLELVPGDIVELKKGDLVPADCRIIFSSALHCDEKSLNCGHSRVEKTSDVNDIPDIAPIEQRKNMLYMGCAILDGTATAVVTETGNSTELGKAVASKDLVNISHLSVFGETVKQSRVIVLVESALCTLLILSGILRGIILHMPFWSNLLYWVTLTVCFISAFMPSKDNSLGYMLCYLKLLKMHKNKIILNRLDTFDKLYKTSVICCDKTGSITKSAQMEVMQIYDGATLSDIHKLTDSAARVLHLAALCCDGHILKESEQEKRIGDSTQTAIISAALEQLGLTEEDLAVTYPRMAELPFDRERKTMCTVNMISGNNFAIVRGAPDKILPMCNKIDADTVNGVATAMASRALRVIAVAIKPLKDVPANPTNDELECDLQFVGLLGLYNPPRKDVRFAVEDCRKSEIKTVMLTGDDFENALAYAKSLGILNDSSEVIDERDLAQMDDAKLSQVIDNYSVFSGVSSESKARIVTALQSSGNTVLMTGDGIEDIDALRIADVGCTPAALGSDITKHISELVTNGGLSAIASSVFNIRRLYHSIRSAFILLYCLGISILIIALTSIFTGNMLDIGQVLLYGILGSFILPLFLSFDGHRIMPTKLTKRQMMAFYPLSGIALAISLIIGFLPVISALKLCVLFICYLIFTQIINRIK